MTDRLYGGLRSVLFFTAVALAILAFTPHAALAAEHTDDLPFTAACVTLPGQLSVGQQTVFAAGHVGGEGEVTYSWSGAVEADGQFARPTFNSAGVKVLYLTAEDEEGNQASARCARFVTSAQLGAVGGAPGTVGQVPTGETGTPAQPADTVGQADEDLSPQAENTEGEGVDEEDTDEAEEISFGESQGASVGRIILWIVIVLIVISLIVLFWRRYSDEHVEEGDATSGDGNTNNNTPKASQEPVETTEETDDTPPISEDDIKEGESNNDEDSNFIIPPAR